MVQLFLKIVCQFLKKLIIELSYDPAIPDIQYPILDLYLRELKMLVVAQGGDGNRE